MGDIHMPALPRLIPGVKYYAGYTRGSQQAPGAICVLFVTSDRSRAIDVYEAVLPPVNAGAAVIQVLSYFKPEQTYTL